MSFRMMATMITLGRLPAALRRCLKAARTGHQAEQRVAEHRPDAGDGADQGVFAAQVRILGDGLGDGGVERPDIVR